MSRLQRRRGGVIVLLPLALLAGCGADTAPSAAIGDKAATAKAEQARGEDKAKQALDQASRQVDQAAKQLQERAQRPGAGAEK